MAISVSGNRKIVEGDELGAVFPANREDCYRELVIDGRKEPFNLGDGAYSTNVLVLGSGKVRGPVFSSRDLRLENDGSQGPQRFLSGVTSKGSVAAEATGETGINSSPTATMDGIRFVFRGDILAKKAVSIRNALVVGSVHAPEINLQHSIVLGNLDATSDIKCSCSTIGMYRCRLINFIGPCSVVVPGGFSLMDPKFDDYKAGDGRNYPAALRYYSLCRTEGVGCGGATLEYRPDENSPPESIPVGFACPAWTQRTCPHAQQVAIERCDFINMDLQGKYRNLLDNQRNAWFMSLQGRAMDLSSVDKANADLQVVLHHVFALEHLSSEARDQQRSEWDKLYPSEQAVIHLATDGLVGRS